MYHLSDWDDAVWLVNCLIWSYLDEYSCSMLETFQRLLCIRYMIYCYQKQPSNSSLCSERTFHASCAVHIPRWFRPVRQKLAHIPHQSGSRAELPYRPKAATVIIDVSIFFQKHCFTLHTNSCTLFLGTNIYIHSNICKQTYTPARLLSTSAPLTRR